MKSLLVLLFFIPLFVSAQSTHKVGPKETLFSLGREYNVHPRELAAYNNIPFDKGLTIGQVIKIPAKTTMAPLSTSAPVTTEPVNTTAVVKTETVVKKTGVIPTTTEDGLAPVYHKVGKKETLYHISVLYNKVPIADLKKWNKLTGDGVSEGTNLIVGYTKSAKVAPVTTEATIFPPPSVPAKVEAIKPKETPVKQIIEEPKVMETKTEVVKTTKPKENAKPVKRADFEGGFFKTVYNNQTGKQKEETGIAGIFKSTSGWEDGKYYCLHNAAPAGTIVKITNNATKKSVYAKVLDVIPDLKQNSGVVIRLSNAAADELGVTDNFECTINF